MICIEVKFKLVFLSSNIQNITYSSQPSTPKLEKEGNSSMFSIYGATTGNGKSYTGNDIFATVSSKFIDIESRDVANQLFPFTDAEKR